MKSRANHRLLLSTVAGLLLSACDDGEVFTEPVPGRDDLSLHTISSRFTDGISDEIVLTAPEGLQSVLFEVRGEDGLYSLSRFYTPKAELIEGAAFMTRSAREVPGLVDWLYPNTPSLTLTPGKHRLTLLGETASGGRLTEDVEIRIYAKKRQDVETCGLQVDFLVDKSAIDREDIDRAIDPAVVWINNLFAPRGIRITDYAITQVALPNPDFDVDKTASAKSQVDDILRQVAARGPAFTHSLNVILVRGIGGSADPFGYSMGLPGPFDGDRPTAAVLAATDKYTNAQGFLDVPGLASTMAHEMGHYLGLYHTSEADKDTAEHDPLPDTPKRGEEGFERNLMTGGGGARRNTLTEDQAFVMKQHPLCIPMKFDPPAQVTCDLSCPAPTTCAIIDGTESCQPACDPDAAPSCDLGNCRPDDLGTYVCR